MVLYSIEQADKAFTLDKKNFVSLKRGHNALIRLTGRYKVVHDVLMIIWQVYVVCIHLQLPQIKPPTLGA